jgi:hypothetical protein
MEHSWRETMRANVYIVVSWGKLEDGVVSGTIRKKRTLLGCGTVLNDHFCAGDDSLLRVFYGSGNAACGLREERVRKSYEGQQKETHRDCVCPRKREWLGQGQLPPDFLQTTTRLAVRKHSPEYD